MPIYLDHRRIQNKRITIKILITIRIISSDLSQRSSNSTSRLQQGSEVWVVALGKMFETLTIIFVGLEFFLEGALTNIVVARKNFEMVTHVFVHTPTHRSGGSLAVSQISNRHQTGQLQVGAAGD